MANWLNIDRLIDDFIDGKINEEIISDYHEVIKYCFENDKSHLIIPLINRKSNGLQQYGHYIFQLACVNKKIDLIKLTMEFSNNSIVKHVLIGAIYRDNLDIIKILYEFKNHVFMEFIKDNTNEFHTNELIKHVNILRWLYETNPDLIENPCDWFFISCRIGALESAKFLKSICKENVFDLKTKNNRYIKDVVHYNFRIQKWLSEIQPDFFTLYNHLLNINELSNNHIDWYIQKYFKMNNLKYNDRIIKYHGDYQALNSKFGIKKTSSIVWQISTQINIFMDFSIFFIKELEDNVLFEPMLINELRDYVFYK